MKKSTLKIKKVAVMNLFLVSWVYAMELPIEYEKDNQKSFKAHLMAGKIDECLMYIEGQKEKNQHYWTLAHEALTCINQPENLLNILKRIEDLLSSSKCPVPCKLIHLAAKYNDLKLLKYLKGKGDSLDQTAALFDAARGNAVEAMKLLKEWGADINARLCFQETLIHCAAQANAIEAMQLLKDWGADINARSDWGMPLHYAAEANAVDAMKLLKEWGGNIDAGSDLGEAPLHYAAEANAIKAMQLLKDCGASIDARNVHQETPFHYAARRNAIEAMKLLKDWGADINARSDCGIPMHYAAQKNALEAMRLLKEWGADINAKYLLTATPFYYAAGKNAIEAMQLLKDWGADINARSNLGTAFHYVAQENAIEAMRLQKKWGGNIDARNRHGETPFHCAARATAIGAMKLLKDWGSNMEEKEEKGNTALALAIRADNKESMDFLCFLGANGDLVSANYEGYKAKNGFECFKFILKINHREPSQSLDDKDGMKLLCDAVEKGLFCSIRKLLNLGQIKDVNQKNDEGYTILHEAVSKNKAYVVKILLTTPEIDPYSRTYGSVEKCDTCKAQRPYDKKLKAHPGRGCKTCGSLTPYDLASKEIKELYEEMRDRIALIVNLKGHIPKEIVSIIMRLCPAKHTYLPKGLFHKKLKVEEKETGIRSPHASKVPS